MLRTDEIARWNTGSIEARDNLSLRWSRDNQWLSACGSHGHLCVYNAATREHWGERRVATSLSLVEYVLGGSAALLWAHDDTQTSLRCVSLSDRSLPEVWRSIAPGEATGVLAVRDDLTRIVLHSQFEQRWALDRELSDEWVSFDGPWHHRSTVRMDQDACRCEAPNHARDLQRFSTAFRGTVTAVRAVSAGTVEVSFAIEARWRGVAQSESTITLRVPVGRSMCPIPSFRQGRRYAVYGDRAHDGSLRVGGCNPSHPT